MDDRYNFMTVVAAKFLIEKEGKILVLREPETNEWMPGRLSLPGGKPFLGESIKEAINRKIETEVGLDIEPIGICKIINILMPEKNVFHCIVRANYKSGNVGEKETEAQEFLWLDRGELSKLTNDDFAEYYYKDLLSDYFETRLELLPYGDLLVQDNRTGDVADWMSKGSK